MNPEARTMLPGIAFRSFVQRFQGPTLEEGFEDIYDVNFEVSYPPRCHVRTFTLLIFMAVSQFKGTDEQKKLWSRYWVSKFST